MKANQKIYKKEYIYIYIYFIMRKNLNFEHLCRKHTKYQLNYKEMKHRPAQLEALEILELEDKLQSIIKTQTYPTETTPFYCT